MSTKMTERMMRGPDKAKVVKTAFKQLDPSNFSVVMATGALSIAFHMLGWTALSKLFLFFGVVAFLFLIFLFGVGFFFSKETMRDGLNLEGLFKYLSFSAGANLLAIAFSLVGGTLLSFIFTFVGVVSAVLLTLALFWQTFMQETVSIQKLTPVWLLLPGAILTSSYALAPLHSDVAHVFWGFGAFLYCVLMGLSLYRVFALPLRSNELSSGFWLWVGIAALAVQTNDPFFWSVATAWIPILFVMLVCKYYALKTAVQYEPLLWLFPFSLAAYAALNQGTSIWVWLSLAAWIYVLYLAAVPFIQNRKK